MESIESLNELFENSICNNWERLALSDLDGMSLHYKDVARKIAKLHILFRSIGLKPGEKVALCGRNSTHWGVAFIATLTYGAVIVPILHEFKPENLHHLINHSESRLLFVDSTIYDNLDVNVISDLAGIIATSDFALLYSRSDELSHAREHLNELFGHEYPERFTPKDVKYFRHSSPEDVVLISYTSGSTGFSKGVMIPERSLRSNVVYTIDAIPFMQPGDDILLMLPMAHMYGLTIEFLFPFSKGCHINFLTRVPSPRILLEAFGRVHPKLIVAVPLILEKIIRKNVFPMLEKPLMRLLVRVPLLDSHLFARIKDRLQQAFGGNLQEIIVGGAALNKEVEAFLQRIGFQVTIGYGMTECAPLISYSSWREARPGACGRVVDRMEVRVDSPDPANIPGVLWTRGANTMLGYYKNPAQTRAVMTEEGWLNTGDIACVDADQFIYLRGRDKNMILGPSGQNIYPEEIEQILNNMPYVSESLIIEEKGRLVALIHPDLDSAQREGLSRLDIKNTMDDNIAQLNRELPVYSQVHSIRIFTEEFEKTPKRSIKRFLYQPSAE